VARLAAGKNLLSPRILLDRRIERVSDKGREAVIERLKDWVREQVERSLSLLRAAGHAAQDPQTPAAIRSILAMLVDEGGIVEREQVADALAAVDRSQRRALSRMGIRIGALDLFMPSVLKPESMRWRTALRVAAAGGLMPDLPAPGSVVLSTPSGEQRSVLARLGFRALGPQMLRVDMAERLASHAHEVRAGKQGELVDAQLITSLGLLPEAGARLLRDIGFRRSDDQSNWVWRGRSRRRPAPATNASSAFAALSELKRG
jgi:ATP-dependent RNA helicase SUPV3L1/SUV3